MVANDNADSLTPRGVLGFIASVPQAGTRSYRGRRRVIETTVPGANR